MTWYSKYSSFFIETCLVYLLPVVAFLLLNDPHDCFRCLGKDPDRVFSIQQYSKIELKHLRLRQKFGKQANLLVVEQSYLEAEVRFATMATQQVGASENQGANRISTDRNSSEDQLLIIESDPLVFQSIDEHDFIRGVAGTFCGEKRQDSCATESDEDSQNPSSSFIVQTIN